MVVDFFWISDLCGLIHVRESLENVAAALGPGDRTDTNMGEAQKVSDLIYIRRIYEAKCEATSVCGLQRQD